MNTKHLLRWAALAVGALALFAVACTSDDSDGTLQTVLDRGELKCGVKDSQPGFGNLEEDGTYTGLDIEFCKAVAAAVLGGPNAPRGKLGQRRHRRR